MSTQQTLNHFFATKFFEVPKYQRSYAWEKQNVRDLFEDIQEALATQSNHYIGAIVLAKTGVRNVFNIVDGQQRLTTVVLFIKAIISAIKDQEDRDYYTRYYIKQRDQFKLIPLERDRDFYKKILESGISFEPQSKSQRHMLEAYEEMKEIVKKVGDPVALLTAIGELSILEFVEEKESDAIRIFQTVNDRGRDLSRMDKMKSLLFYFSSKYLRGKYDDDINDIFGEIFELYDSIELIADRQKINVINSKQFNEDDLLRHHHICFSQESYEPTAQQVLENIKFSLNHSRSEGDFDGLDRKIINYITSLLEYVIAFNKVIKKCEVDVAYYKLFSIQGVSAVYYPVITQLEKKNLLDQMLPGKGIKILAMIEIIDVRVFKVRDYQGKKHAANFAYKLNTQPLDIEEIKNHLLWFNSHEISDDRFRDYLSNYDYSKNTSLLRTLFIDYCERLRNQIYSIDELKTIIQKEPSIEHILSQTPNFKPKAFGFKDNEDFESYKNMIGNLTILEKIINSSIKNSDLVEKLKGYGKSKFKVTNALSTHLAISNGIFKKEDLENRSQELVDNFSVRWWAS